MINLLIQTICLITLLVVYFFMDLPKFLDEGYMSFIVSVNFVSLLSFLAFRKEQNEHIKGQYLRLSIVYLFSFIIVHFQVYIDYILGNINSSHMFLWMDTTIVIRAMVLSSVAFIVYIYGYSWNRKNFYRPRAERGAKVTSDNRVLFFIGVPLIILFLVTINTSSTDAIEVSGVSGYSGLMLEALIIAYVILNCRNIVLSGKRTVSIKDYVVAQRSPIILAAIYIFIKLLIGDRGPIIISVLAFTLGYIYVTKAKVSLLKLAFFIITASFIMNVIGLARRLDKSESFLNRVNTTIENREILYYPSSFLPNTRELASSVRTLHISVSNVPSYITHFNGLFFIEDLMLFIPSLRSTFIRVFDIPKQFSSSAQFITWISLGENRTWGTGTSSVADTYLDFGIFGILIVYFIFGYLSRGMELVIASNAAVSILVLVCVFLVFSYSVYIPRSTILYSLNKFAYVLFFIFIPTKLIRTKGNL